MVNVTERETASPVPAAAAAEATAARWRRKDLLDTDTLSRAEIDAIMETADGMAEIRSRPVGRVATLRGATVVTLFYEQSTRTRASFEVAAKALGADVVNLAASGSSVEKGESLIGTVRTLEAIGADVIVMRHPRSGAPYLAARHSSSSIVNGGDGMHAHPTQALLDLYTMRRTFGDMAGRTVAIIGDVLHSRVARSNAWTLTAMGARVVLCGPPTLLPATLANWGEDPGQIRITTDLDEALSGADVVMTLRLQKERQDRGLIASVREYARHYQVNEARLERAAPGVMVMHPGPINEGVEISPAVAHGARSVIEAQVTNGVAVRMAVLYLMASGRHG